MTHLKKNRLTLAVYALFQWTWGLPQTLAGFLVFLWLTLRKPRRNRIFFHGAVASQWSLPYGLSLGMFIFISDPGETDVLVHEWGHSVQSLILGPFYLFLIGLPSAVWCVFPPVVRMRRRKRLKYTSFYCERWASLTGQRLTGMEALWR